MELKLIFVLYSIDHCTGDDVSISSSSSTGCGCCPLPKCDVKPFSCSLNANCECLLMTVHGGGMCASTVRSCSALTPCQSDNQTCSAPNTMCP
ncbi:unnamed protein product [Rotaria magnacalcarata]|uniref:Uncharacterized protein n=3 Tax=Rotaria magnacalcarata TaxID=392030 RepID=A0A816H9B3_9BILA|nr:unnamed protein product [Rotaria magnacalcarata]